MEVGSPSLSIGQLGESLQLEESSLFTIQSGFASRELPRLPRELPRFPVLGLISLGF